MHAELGLEYIITIWLTFTGIWAALQLPLAEDYTELYLTPFINEFQVEPLRIGFQIHSCTIESEIMVVQKHLLVRLGSILAFTLGFII